MNTFRPTPARSMVVRLAFINEARSLLAHVFREAEAHLFKVEHPEERWLKEGRHGEQCDAIISAKLRDLFGERPRVSAWNGDGYGDDSGYHMLAGEVGRRAMWASDRAALYRRIGDGKPLRGILPEGYGFDGEVSRVVSAILTACRKAWEAAGKEMAGEEWRTLDMSLPMIRLPLPRGWFSIRRDLVIAEDVRGEFTGKLIIDERLAVHGGPYRKAGKPNDPVWRLQSLDKTAGLGVIARAVIRTEGRYFAKEVLRRLRRGAKPTFSAVPHARCRQGGAETRVSIPCGRRDAAESAFMIQRANRLERLAALHGKIVAELAEHGRKLANIWASQSDIVVFETRIRFEHAMEGFNSARRCYNESARKLCLKKDLANLPYAEPPEVFPRPRASLCDRDSVEIHKAEEAFVQNRAELRLAAQTMMTLGLRPEAIVERGEALSIEAAAGLLPPKGGEVAVRAAEKMEQLTFAA